jgi:hypothetical protein
MPLNCPFISRIMLAASHVTEFGIGTHGVTVFAVEATHNHLLAEIVALGYAMHASRYS